MNFMEVVNDNMSKENIVAIACMACLVQATAEPWQIMAVGMTAIIMRGIINLRKPKNKEKSMEEKPA